MTIWVTSDTHFSHHNIIKYCDRPFLSVEGMNEVLIDNWNSKVKPNDTVWHLGDFGFGPVESLQRIFDQLNGHKNLIIGNHDKEGVKISGWEIVTPYFELVAHNLFVVMCHYPLAQWNRFYHGSIHLHGHCHGRFNKYNTETVKRLDVGVDCFDYIPVSLFEIKKFMAKKKKPSPLI